MYGRLEMFRNRHCGERGVIVANGPSLNTMSLAFLKKEHVIGVNKIYLGLKKFGFYPRYYVAINRKVICQSVAQITALRCVKFIGSRGADLIREDGLTYHIQTTAVSHRFGHDISRGVHEGWTVTHAALQVAYFMGFNEVVIIGMDHRYDYEGAPNEASVLHGMDANHFDPAYFGGGQDWDNPDLRQSEESYRIAREEFEKDGRRIIDATVNGACTVFEKSDYRKIFGLQS